MVNTVKLCAGSTSSDATVALYLSRHDDPVSRGQALAALSNRVPAAYYTAAFQRTIGAASAVALLVPGAPQALAAYHAATTVSGATREAAAAFQELVHALLRVGWQGLSVKG